jgi:SCF-associated factor 1
MVLKGGDNTTPEMHPIIIPELQNRSIISVVCGASHFGALTSSGKLLTWGQYYMGALGLGDPHKLPIGSPGGFTEFSILGPSRSVPDVTVPSEVRFDHELKAEGKVERYCFAVAACGYHTAALVVDLTGDEIPPEDLEQHFKTVLSDSHDP